MPRKHACPLCGRTFTTSQAALEHLKKEHVGKLSDQSVEYLMEQGVPARRIMEFGATEEQIQRCRGRIRQPTLEAWVVG